MPETSGLEVQARLNDVSPDTKVIVITARETPSIRNTALEGSAFAFLVKPFDDETFPSSTSLRGMSDVRAQDHRRSHV